MGGNEILHEDHSLRFLARKNLSVAVWSASPEVSQIRAVYRLTERRMKAMPAGQALLNVVIRGMPSFTQEARDELVKLLKNRSHSLGTAHLVLVDGLGGTAIRSLVSTVMLIARPPAPHRVFGKKDDAISWLSAQLRPAPDPWSTDDLRDVLEQALKGR